jgi:hypothetical protein
LVRREFLERHARSVRAPRTSSTRRSGSSLTRARWPSVP